MACANCYHCREIDELKAALREAGKHFDAGYPYRAHAIIDAAVAMATTTCTSEDVSGMITDHLDRCPPCKQAANEIEEAFKMNNGKTG